MLAFFLPEAPEEMLTIFDEVSLRELSYDTWSLSSSHINKPVFLHATTTLEYKAYRELT